MNGSSRQVPIVRQSFDQHRQMYTAELAQPLAEGSTCNFTIHYQGLLNDKLVGFYRSKFDTAEGETR